MTERPRYLKSEDETIKKMYPSATKAEIQAAMPDRSWDGICVHARRKGIHRTTEARAREIDLGRVDAAKARLAAGVSEPKSEMWRIELVTLRELAAKAGTKDVPMTKIFEAFPHKTQRAIYARIARLEHHGLISKRKNAVKLLISITPEGEAML